MTEPLRLLIGALGGEGGGVLAGWITDAAVAEGCWAQRTSIPGVAQRTGATTYYIEILPGAESRPVLALNPAPGRVDVVLASELLEAARAVQNGFVTPDRTLLVASTHRVFTVTEKAQMADGRLDGERLRDVATRFARRALLADMREVAEAARAPLNAVMLGALAGTGALPLPANAFRDAIRRAGKAVDGNLRGFDAGLRLADRPEPRTEPAGPQAGAPAEAVDFLPGDAGRVAAEGLRRLADYQDEAYARLYLDRLRGFADRPGADPDFLRELARHLALRMSFEDTIRVAELKRRAARIARLRQEARARPGDIVRVTEFLKPGPEEILSVLPARLAGPLLAWIARRGWMGLSLPMRVRTTSPFGYLRLSLLAGLKRWRPASLRYADEQAWIARWLDLVDRTLARDPAAAREVVETAGLVKGYGDTFKRGRANWRRIAEEVIEPMLDGRLPAAHFADAVLQARLAALADPEGDRLGQVIAAIRALAGSVTLASEPRSIAAE